MDVRMELCPGGTVEQCRDCEQRCSNMLLEDSREPMTTRPSERRTSQTCGKTYGNLVGEYFRNG